MGKCPERVMHDWINLSIINFIIYEAQVMVDNGQSSLTDIFSSRRDCLQQTTAGNPSLFTGLHQTKAFFSEKLRLLNMPTSCSSQKMHKTRGNHMPLS